MVTSLPTSLSRSLENETNSSGENPPVLETLFERNLVLNMFDMNMMTSREHFELSKPQAADRYVTARNHDKLPRHLPNPLPPPPFPFFAVELKFSGCQKHAIKRRTFWKCKKVSKDLLIIYERFARLLSLRTDVKMKNVVEEERLRF